MALAEKKPIPIFGKPDSYGIGPGTDDDDMDYVSNDFKLPQNIKTNQKYVDKIGDITKKLNNNNCKFIEHIINNEDNIKKKDNLLQPIYDKFKKQINNNSYPYKRRFCMILDRRNYFRKKQIFTHENNKKDKIIFYEPPQNCNVIPDWNVPEWQYDSVRSCLIPSKISVETPCNGGLLTFSFHVESSNEISCYMWWNCQCIRFLPQDIIDILPRIFDQNYENPQTGKNNSNFAKSTNAKEFVNKFKIKDIHFNDWWNKTGHYIGDLQKYKK